MQHRLIRRRQVLTLTVGLATSMSLASARAEDSDPTVQTLELPDGLAFSWSEKSLNFAARVCGSELDTAFTGQSFMIVNDDLVFAASTTSIPLATRDPLLSFAESELKALSNELFGNGNGNGNGKLELKLFGSYAAGPSQWFHWELARATDDVPLPLATVRHVCLSRLVAGRIVTFELLLGKQDDIRSARLLLQSVVNSFVESDAPIDLPRVFLSPPPAKAEHVQRA